MFFVLVPIAWLSLIAIFWAACAMARRGDAELQSRSSVDRTDDSSEAEFGEAELVVPESLPEPTVRDVRRTSPSVH
jgi:hypothetical protein